MATVVPCTTSLDAGAAGASRQPRDGLDHGPVVARWRREQLVHPDAPVGLVEDHVGERAADIDADRPGAARSATCSFAI